MSYFVTIYTDPILYDNDKFTDYSNILSALFGVHSVTHTFISLTHKSPSELIKENNEWYLSIYPSILDKNNDEGFFGFGTGEDKNTNKGNILYDYLNGKIFENNQYISEASYSSNAYMFKSIRGEHIFQYGFCPLEISNEKYRYLLDIIYTELLETHNITPRSDTINNPKYQYHLTENNCTQWVQRLLNEIEIEQYLFHLDYVTIPDTYAKLYNYIYQTNEIIHRLSLVDKNLLTVKGAKAVKFWMRANFYNLHDIKSKDISNFLSLKVNQNLFEILFSVDVRKEADKLISSLFNQYTKLKKYIDNLCQKDADSYCTGTFHFIYVDNGQLKIMKPENGYVPETLQELDASKPYNNYTLGKYLYFIFIPDEEYEYIYHKYSYGQVDKEYNQSINECYKQVLLGNTDNMKYYSQSLNKLLDKQKSNTFHQV